MREIKLIQHAFSWKTSLLKWGGEHTTVMLAVSSTFKVCKDKKQNKTKQKRQAGLSNCRDTPTAQESAPGTTTGNYRKEERYSWACMWVFTPYGPGLACLAQSHLSLESIVLPKACCFFSHFHLSFLEKEPCKHSEIC